MNTTFQFIDFMEENDLYKDGTSDIDLSALAKLLEVQQKDLAKAFNISESQISRGATNVTGNAFLKQWMGVFDMLSSHIKNSEPAADKERIRLKMSRWLKTPSIHFKNNTPLEMMIDGKTRRVIKLLEQITG
ncbi:MAG: DUF2384 domain-containing protein [Bacteriovoracaceae bacterium]|nr:DUF2384 domain-containing protein [Candidatus Brocadiales bacterium]MBL6992055.1 DUF2384 domain-containing protein [Bacteriovoracaceae bacterium]